METTSISHRPAPVLAIATAGLVGTLMAVTLTSAGASPGRDDSPGVPGQTVHTGQTVHPGREHLERGCFMTPASWNEALDGPLPRCY